MESEIHVIKKKGASTSFQSQKWGMSMPVMVILSSLHHLLLTLHFPIHHLDQVMVKSCNISPIPP